MRIRWRLVLPLLGLLIFGAITKNSFYIDRVTPHHPHRYFWWSSIRLDPDPLNKRPYVLVPCKEGQKNYMRWDLRDMWVEPGWLPKWFMVSALPAFVAGMVTVRAVGRLGVNEFWSFLTCMPFLIIAWFYFLGWPLDRWKSRRAQRT